MGRRLLTKAEPLRCQPEGQNGNQVGGLRSRQNLSTSCNSGRILCCQQTGQPFPSHVAETEGLYVQTWTWTLQFDKEHDRIRKPELDSS